MKPKAVTRKSAKKAAPKDVSQMQRKLDRMEAALDLQTRIIAKQKQLMALFEV